MKINLYDFDNTIYEGDSSTDFFFYCLKKYPKIVKIIPKIFLSAIKYKLRVWCKIENKFQVQRAILRIVKIELDEKNIQIPYNQLDVHTK